ncbi:Lon protease family protein [Azovibrio restrictus]|uniref:Lon protease family protein n=1 Tax=Azovibrio restrictus TaxID=146938 RepID=UPI0026F30E94|nr:AAA family ATPase [Azovibrio restrictus]MDD3482290.1 AAA family ATPase [Azovibrio restrictus]
MSTSSFPPALAPEQLRRCCDPSRLGFASTAELEPLPEGLGQERAEEALHFGLGMAHPGYHVFVLGEPGTSRHTTVFRLLQEMAARGRTPPDLCYLHNFEDPRTPRLLRLPAGRGARLRADLQQLVRELTPAIDAALDADSHVDRVEALQDNHKKREEEAIAALGKAAEAEGLGLLNTAEGFVFAPMREGQPMSPEDFEALSEAEHQAVEASVETWTLKLADLLADFPGWRQELQEAIARAERQALRPVLAHLTRGLRRHYADLAEVLAFIDAIRDDVIDCVAQGKLGEEEGAEEAESEGPKVGFQRYQVNLLVDHSETRGAPVVCEDNPGFGNLIGSIEHLPLPGGQSTHFSMIRPGALHRASGGYLVLDAGRLLTQPFAWDGLKRALRSGRIAIEPPAEAQGWSSQATLRPEPAPCQVKVVLVGERELYYMLMENDPDFSELFKVAADFEDELLRTPENEASFARLLASLVRGAGLLPFDGAATALLIEEAARHAEHAERLSLHTRYLGDLMREAEYQARRADPDVSQVGSAAIRAALAARARRADRYPRHVLESTLEGSTLISTDGERAGQANALVVVELAGERYGHPVRVTATARVGDGDVVDIERETELGGAIHSKGVLIITAFLAARYARHQPLSLAASLVFEQSYGQVEGDSASLAELCALLSALAQAPIRQSLALTGSVNQFGEVQVIGGVNEKIEGFYDLCKARGLTGDQGVLIPAASVPHLMLRPDVVEAAAAGRFHVWPVATVDEAMELLTGLPAGEADARGHLPRGSLNERVAQALAEMTAALHPPHPEERPAWRKSVRHNRFSGS